MMELVDFNELLLAETGDVKAKTRRSRRGSGSKKSEDQEVVSKNVEVIEDAVVVEESKTEEDISTEETKKD
jgi:large subunit ribosomal protein L17